MMIPSFNENAVFHSDVVLDKRFLPHPASQYRLLMGAVIGLFIFPTIFFGARMYSQARIVGRFFIDDYILIAAWLLTLAWTGVVSAFNYLNLGPNWEYNYYHRIPLVTALNWTQFALFNAGFTLAKLSIAATYLRVFYAMPLVRWSILASTVFMMANAIGSTIGAWYIDHRSMDMLDFARTVRDRNLLLYTTRSTELFAECWLLLTLLVSVARMRMKPKAKAGVLVIVSAGGLLIAITAVRFALQLYTNGKIRQNPNRTYIAQDVVIWQAAQVGLAVFVAAAPSLRLIWQVAFPAAVTRSEESKDRSPREVKKEDGPRRRRGLYDFSTSLFRTTAVGQSQMHTEMGNMGQERHDDVQPGTALAQALELRNDSMNFNDKSTDS